MHSRVEMKELFDRIHTTLVMMKLIEPGVVGSTEDNGCDILIGFTKNGHKNNPDTRGHKRFLNISIREEDTIFVVRELANALAHGNRLLVEAIDNGLLDYPDTVLTMNITRTSIVVRTTRGETAFASKSNDNN